MKLASLPQARDGRLVVVSDDLAWYTDADHIVPTMQHLLDAWDRNAPLLESLAIELAHGAIPRKRFHEREAAAPLPRCFHRAGGSDALHGARDALVLPSGGQAAHFEPSVVVVTGQVPEGASPETARDCIRLVGLASDVALPASQGSTIGMSAARPASYCSPVFVTPATLGAVWQEGRLRSAISVERSGSAAAQAIAATDFGALLASLSATRAIGPGALVGAAVAGLGGNPLSEGEVVRIESRDEKGHSIFGAIEHKVQRY